MSTHGPHIHAHEPHHHAPEPPPPPPDDPAARKRWEFEKTVYEQDRLVFLEYAKAVNANDAGLANFLLTRIATPDLRAGIKWWQAQPTKTAPPTPFSPKNPDYGAADRLTAKVGKNFEVAKKQQDTSDHFTLVEVILASALFLFGIAGVTRRFSLKFGTVMAGTAIFAIAIGFFVSA